MGLSVTLVEVDTLASTTGRGATTSTAVTFSNTTESTSATTGAVKVSGGLGVAKNAYVGQTLFAASKSFLIDHPLKPGMKLCYGSLEGPENGVYVRGKLTNESVIVLPDYWVKLVDQSTITVNLTPIGKHQKLYVASIDDNKITIANDGIFAGAINCFYHVFAERVDVPKLQVEMY